MCAWIIGITLFGVAVPTLQPARRGAAHWPAGAVIRVWSEVRTAPPDASALIAKALASWTRAAAGRVVLQQVAARDSAVVRIRFADADGIYGETSPRIDRTTGLIQAADVLIARSVGADRVRQNIVVYLTALHELGHALGLPHTASFDDIMYAFSRPDDGERYFGAYQRRLRSADDIGTPFASGLSPGDIVALQTLYQR
jgi:hypothetical protein